MKLRDIFIAAMGIFLVSIAQGQAATVAKVSVLSSGKLLLNGSASSLMALEVEFQRLQRAKGSVWYYREKPTAEPPPEAMAVIKLIVKYRLPVSMSSKPDFSDYVGVNGRSVPRSRDPL